MWQLDRDRIWFTAWASVPVAIALNMLVSFDVERATLVSKQALVDWNLGRWEVAAERFGEAGARDPGSVLMAHNAAVSYLRAGRVAEARYWNRETLLRDPEFEEAKRMRASLNRMQGGRPGPGAEPSRPGLVQPP